LFDQPSYPGEALITIVFTEHGGKTFVSTTIRYESRQARRRAQDPMESGLAQSYDRLAELLASTPAGRGADGWG
jgi:uncharacterized protein YndB with AHSA1/START domain